jgi:hypothetical protein
MSTATDTEDWDGCLLRLLRMARGIRVQPTAHAIEQGIAKASDRGTVTSWGSHRWSVMVRKDGRKTSTSYHVSFWRPLKQATNGSRSTGAERR